MFGDQLKNNDSFLFKENLSNYSDFRTDALYYRPILGLNYSLNYFRSPGEPYLVYESDDDSIWKTNARHVRHMFHG